ncbi:hypothetical protein DH2020_008958 [Rehmannia glutinosa]|uniref:Plus3 domain-containing protein n=1 Tax=Rehmannia glutinosa TaxID=99300 RepID=A0ABR0X8P3_REHGL
MMSRAYGRRGRALNRSYSGTNSFANGISESSSQEFSQDVYDFTFPSEDSTRCHWSDPYSFSSSQESGQLAFLPPRKGGDCDGEFRESKKVKMIGVDPKRNGAGSSQESKKFGVLGISDGELEEIVAQPQRKGRENNIYDFSEHGDLWTSKKSKNIDLDSYLLSSSQELSDLGIPQSRKREGNGDHWDFDGVSGKTKKKDRGENGVLLKKKKKKMKSKVPTPDYVELTTTLMETQEFGEMMEHEDEVNFALDGLKKGQPVRIRRASLLSLLSVCGTVQQRRLLKVHGMAKTIIDAVLGLSFDDTPSNLAAAALFYILTIDGHDDHLLDSPSSIRFLIKLLKPLSSSAVKEKALPVGSKLLSLCKSGFLQESAKGTDSSSTAIMIKVREILVNCKEMKPRDASDDGMEEPELNPKWISLLTMEKACSSNISIEDTSGALRKTGGKFKEKLREFGGIDAVFEVARKCHSVMEEWLEKSPIFALDPKDISGLESLVLLLKCLKIMENATFLSNDNQRHLIGMKGNFDGQRAPRSFTKLVLSVIKILSGVSLLRNSLGSSQDEKMDCISFGNSQLAGLCSLELTSQESFNQYDHCKSSVEPTELFADPLLLKLRVESSQAGLCSGTSRNSDSVAHISSNNSETEFGIGKDSQDPFAFHDDEFEPSKWDLLSGSANKSSSQDSRATVSGYRNGSHSVPVLSQQESNNMEYRHSQEASCSSAVDEDTSNLLADCLLTAVKVLMNLTNDNPEGCQQIASCGGLEILSSLVAGHFPSFRLSLPCFDDVRDSSLSSKSSPRINTPLTDRELDFLVALLGLLVNLVEKDGRNRSRLAAATVSLPNPEGPDSEDQSDVISLLCSIFLANQGNNEAAGEETNLSWEDEESILQGEKEAEKMIVEAYAALLLAFLSTESKSVRNAIAQCLPNHNLKTLVPVLERFLEFHLTLNMISPETHTAVLEVIESSCCYTLGRQGLMAGSDKSAPRRRWLKLSYTNDESNSDRAYSSRKASGSQVPSTQDICISSQNDKPNEIKRKVRKRTPPKTQSKAERASALAELSKRRKDIASRRISGCHNPPITSRAFADEEKSDGYEDDTSPESNFPMFEDVKKITIRRSILGKWFMEPFFDEMIAGCFVRVRIGYKKFGVPVYRLCTVRNVDATKSDAVIDSRTDDVQVPRCHPGQRRRSPPGGR